MSIRIGNGIGIAGALTLGLGVAGFALADSTEELEFQRRAASLGQAINADNSGRPAHCEELHRSIEDLRGRPQRRFSALEAYELECQGGGPRSFGTSPMDAQMPTFQSDIFR